MRAVFLSAALCFSGGAVFAEAIERACLQSGRAGGDRALCGCIQDAANMTLSQTDQRQAARFFSNPDEAQSVRMSSRRSDEVFWERYKTFGETAEAFCSS